MKQPHENVAEPSFVSPQRLRLFQIMTPIIILLVVINSWGLGNSNKTSENAEQSAKLSQASFSIESLEFKAYTFQSQLMVGAIEYLKQKQKQKQKKLAKLNFDIDNLVSNLRNQITRDLENETKQDFSNKTNLPTITHRKLILARFFQIPNLAKKSLSAMSVMSVPKKDRLIHGLLLEAMSQQPHKNVLTHEQCEQLIKAMPWFGKLAASMAALDPIARDEYRKQATEVAINTFVGFMIALCVIVIILPLSFIASMILLYRYKKGLIKSSYSFKGIPRSFCLEVFCLYLIGMLLQPRLVMALHSVYPSANVFMLNAITIISLLGLLAWPLGSGYTFSEVRKATGLHFTSATATLRNATWGPYVYIASIFWFMSLLVAYSLVLNALGVQIDQGTHPIIPALLATKDQTTIIWIIFLAVIMAPLVEEIMFRGILYSYLRNKLGITTAVLSSAFLFAIVHPQGPIGIFPLMIIGSILALLREWRNSLITPMAAHACFNAGTLCIILTIARYA